MNIVKLLLNVHVFNDVIKLSFASNKTIIIEQIRQHIEKLNQVISPIGPFEVHLGQACEKDVALEGFKILVVLIIAKLCGKTKID